MISGIFHSTYEKDMALRRTHAQRIRLVLIVLFMLVFPFLANRYYLTLANQVGIAVIGAIGLNILVGYTGQIRLRFSLRTWQILPLSLRILIQRKFTVSWMAALKS